MLVYLLVKNALKSIHWLKTKISFGLVWFGLVLWHIKHWRLFNAKSLFILTVLFITIQLTISRKFSSIWPVNWTLLGSTTPSQSEPESGGNKWVLRIPLKDYRGLTIRLFSVISGHSLGVSYPSAEIQSVYSAAPTDWASKNYKYLVNKQRFRF